LVAKYQAFCEEYEYETTYLMIFLVFFISLKGAVYGENSKKILHFGVKNKLCTICVANVKKPQHKKNLTHECFVNFGNGSSGSMEPLVAVEAVNSSKKEHNLIYSTFITDGDASTPAAITANGEYGCEIKHLKCSIHSMKAFKRLLFKVNINIIILDL
jgi:hypothetical protein